MAASFFEGKGRCPVQRLMEGEIVFWHSLLSSE
jgi:hypothetical protein